LQADRSRFTLSATASWKPPDSNVRVAASKLREEREVASGPRCRIVVKGISSGLRTIQPVAWFAVTRATFTT
jgi:hypothetical protein